MRNLFSILYLALCLKTTFAQTAIEWSYNYGGSQFDEAKSVCNSYSSGFIIAGTTASDDGGITDHHVGSGVNIWIQKISESGLPIWNKIYGGPGIDELGKIIPTLDYGYILIGSTTSNGIDVSGKHLCADANYWVVKIDSLGNIQWQNCYGSCGHDSGIDIIQTADSGYLLSGQITNGGADANVFHGFYDIWVCKIDVNGSQQWDKTLGGTDYDVIYSTLQMEDGGYLIAGGSASTNFDVTGLHGGEDVWIVKLDSIGQIEWQKCYGGSGIDFASKILPASEKGFFVFATTTSIDGDVATSLGGYDLWLFKCDSSGNIQWQKTYGGTSHEAMMSAVKDVGGGFLMLGEVFSDNGMVTNTHGALDFWVVKSDSIGNFLWGKALGGSDDDRPKDIIQTGDGGCLAIGYSRSNDGDVPNNWGIEDFWAVKLESPTVGVKEASATTSSLILFQIQSELVLQFFSKTKEVLQMNIYDLNGRLVVSKDLSSVIGENRTGINLENLVSGIYFISLKGEKNLYNNKFVLN